jgi:hypothetical protein
MIKRLFQISLALFVLQPVASLVHACECKKITEEMSQKNYDDALYVIKGKVLGIKPYLNGMGSGDPVVNRYSQAKIQVIQSYKGVPNKVMSVLYFLHQKSCGLGLKEDVKSNFLVFTDSSGRLYLNSFCVNLTRSHWDKLQTEAADLANRVSPLLDLNIEKGMTRSEVEEKIAKALNKPDTYSPYGNNLKGGTVKYRDDKWVLEILYKAGVPAPWDAGGGKTKHLPPVDETVQSHRLTGPVLRDDKTDE